VENYWEVSNFIKRQLIGSTPALDNYFYTRKIIKIAGENGYEAGLKELKDNAGRFALRQSVVERIGYKLLFEKKNKQAIDVFKINAFYLPDSSYVYNSLAEAYALAGNKDLAIENYKKYLALEPDDKDTEIKLKKLSSLK